MISRSDEGRQIKPGLRASTADEAHDPLEDSMDDIKGTDISDADEMKGPARKVEKGRAKPEGEPAEIDGAHQGSGDGGAASHRNTLGHGEREATISGAYQGQHSKD